MKVILLSDVKSVGKKGDIVTVSDAYGRNVLLSKKLALEASNVNLNNLKIQKKHKERAEEENLRSANELAEKLKDLKIEVTIKTGDGGRIFGSVSTKEISAAVKSQLGLDIDKKKMQITESIKSLGTHEVSIRLHPKVTGILRVHVNAE